MSAKIYMEFKRAYTVSACWRAGWSGEQKVVRHRVHMCAMWSSIFSQGKCLEVFSEFFFLSIIGSESDECGYKFLPSNLFLPFYYSYSFPWSFSLGPPFGSRNNNILISGSNSHRRWATSDSSLQRSIEKSISLLLLMAHQMTHRCHGDRSFRSFYPSVSPHCCMHSTITCASCCNRKWIRRRFRCVKTWGQLRYGYSIWGGWIINICIQCYDPICSLKPIIIKILLKWYFSKRFGE